MTTAIKRLKKGIFSVLSLPDGYVKMNVRSQPRHNSSKSGDASGLPRVEVKLAEKKDATFKILSDNRQAGHNYFLMDRLEAGMVLTGTEVKAAKDGKIQLKDAYASVIGNEAWLLNAHISQYSHGNRENHPPVRNRKLLLHRREIDKLLVTTRDKGLALIPTKIYLKEGRIKCEIAVAKGKKLHDKREAERTRTAEAEARAEMRRRA
jgi:SsrA-binding protein